MNKKLSFERKSNLFIRAAGQMLYRGMKTAVNEEIYAAPTRCRTTKHGYEVSMVRIRAMAKRRKIRQEYEKEVRLHAWSVILRADNDLHVHTTHSLNHHVPVCACG